MTEREESTAKIYAEIARTQGWWVTPDGRIGEEDAAYLLGWSKESLRNARSEGRAPPSYPIGGARHKRSYRISDLAVWVESQREA